jgi:hypothetical protein
MNTKQNTNGTLNFTDVDIKQITVEMYKGQPLIKYMKKDLTVQAPWFKMNGYGLAPGETLSNGDKNKYFKSDEERDYMKVPLDPETSCVSDEDGTNSEQIQEFVNFLKAVDKHIKYSVEIRTLAGIDEDNIEKYNPCYKKQKTLKTVNQETGKTENKVKLPYMKLKLSTIYPSKNNIDTKFFDVNPETNQTTRILTGQYSNQDYISLDDLVKYYRYNCEQLPVIKFVKVWKIDGNDTWGVTMKLLLSKIKKQVKVIRDDNSDFLDIKKNKKDVKETKQMQQVQSDDSDDEVISKKAVVESDEEPVPKKVVKKPQVSDDSDDEPEPVKTKPDVKKRVVKQEVESDSDDEVVSVKKSVKGKGKK